MAEKNNKYLGKNEITIVDIELQELRDLINVYIQEATRQDGQNPFLFPKPSEFSHLVISISNLLFLLISMLPFSKA
jgi:hypothetical protein